MQVYNRFWLCLTDSVTICSQVEEVAHNRKWLYGSRMRTNSRGKDIQVALTDELGRVVQKNEITAALGLSAADYSRKLAPRDDFPNFEELTAIAEYFDLVPAGLHYDFGLIDDEAIEYLRKHRSGHPTMTTSRKEVAMTQRDRRVKTAKSKPPL